MSVSYYKPYANVLLLVFFQIMTTVFIIVVTSFYEYVCVSVPDYINGASSDWQRLFLCIVCIFSWLSIWYCIHNGVLFPKEKYFPIFSFSLN